MLTDERLTAFASSLELYRASASKKRGAELLFTAGLLANYCATHRLDPDNSLIGLSPSTRALQSCIDEERAATLPSSTGAAQNKSRKLTSAVEGDLVLVEQSVPPDVPVEVRVSLWKEEEEEVVWLVVVKRGIMGRGHSRILPLV